MQCWVHKTPKLVRPNLLVIHGIKANGMWRWNDFVSPLGARIIVYVYFADFYRMRHERSKQFQAQFVVALMEAIDVKKMNVVGMSYRGFVGQRSPDLGKGKPSPNMGTAASLKASKSRDTFTWPKSSEGAGAT
ncbi:hypothetical protein NL676_005960 [Syzygium grande]|nr:hypothetical protein NL676_005960 [Syzygium grande]